MEAITRTAIADLQKEIMGVITPILIRHNLTANTSGQYSNAEGGSINIALSIKDDDGSNLFEKKNWIRQTSFPHSYLKPEDFGKVFADSQGLIHVIMSYNTRAKKRPIITTASNGHQYSWTAAQVSTMLELAPKV